MFTVVCAIVTTVVLHHIFRFVIFGIPHHHHHHHHQPRIKIQRHTLEPIGVDALSFLLSLATHIRCLVDSKILSAVNIHNSPFSFLLPPFAVDSVYPYGLFIYSCFC